VEGEDGGGKRSGRGEEGARGGGSDEMEDQYESVHVQGNTQRMHERINGHVFVAVGSEASDDTTQAWQAACPLSPAP